MNTALKDHVLVDAAELRNMIQLLDMASDVAEQFAIICKNIEDKAQDHREIRLIARLGRSHGESWSNTFDCDREQYQERYFSKK